MIVHPNFKDFPSNPKASAKPLDLVFLLFPLQLPPQLVREAQHFLLLLLRELGPEPLLSRRVPRRSAAAVYHLRVVRGDFAVEVAVAAACAAVEGSVL